ncbi:MAG: 2-dehydro-3-deoxy-6-phosphogalactonate aldolase [Burkholderiaceae bacterium]
MFDLQTYPCPLVAILRGLPPVAAEEIAGTLFKNGFRMLEVPLNRPGACDAIQKIRNIAPADVIVGGGTMLTRDDVDAVYEAGGRLMVSPNCEPEVIRYAVDKGMLALPGVATPTEAFRALDAGAHGLKLFPAEMISPSVVKAIRSVLPSHVHVMPVGGVNPNNMKAYSEAGATGFGIGSQLYQPGMNADAVTKSASAFMQARQALL